MHTTNVTIWLIFACASRDFVPPTPLQPAHRSQLWQQVCVCITSMVSRACHIFLQFQFFIDSEQIIHFHFSMLLSTAYITAVVREQVENRFDGPDRYTGDKVLGHQLQAGLYSDHRKKASSLSQLRLVRMTSNSFWEVWPSNWSALFDQRNNALI